MENTYQEQDQQINQVLTPEKIKEIQAGFRKKQLEDIIKKLHLDDVGYVEALMKKGDLKASSGVYSFRMDGNFPADILPENASEAYISELIGIRADLSRALLVYVSEIFNYGSMFLYSRDFFLLKAGIAVVEEELRRLASSMAEKKAKKEDYSQDLEKYLDIADNAMRMFMRGVSNAWHEDTSTIGTNMKMYFFDYPYGGEYTASFRTSFKQLCNIHSAAMGAKAFLQNAAPELYPLVYRKGMELYRSNLFALAIIAELTPQGMEETIGAKECLERHFKVMVDDETGQLTISKEGTPFEPLDDEAWKNLMQQVISWYTNPIYGFLETFYWQRYQNMQQYPKKQAIKDTPEE